MLNSIYINLENFANKVYNMFISLVTQYPTISKILLIAFLVRVSLAVIKLVYQYIKKIYEAIINLGKSFKSEGIQKRFLSVALINSKDFFYSVPIFKDKSFGEKWSLLIKSGMLMVLNLKYINKIFTDGIYIDDFINKSIVLDEKLKILIKQFIILPDKLTLLKIEIINISNGVLEFNMPITRKKEWSYICLNKKDGSRIVIKSCENVQENFMRGGILDTGQTIECDIYFETIENQGLKDITNIQVIGFLKLKGSRSEFKYEKTISVEKLTDDKVRQFLKDTFEIVDLFNLFKTGGLMYLFNRILLIALVLSVIFNRYIGSLIFIVCIMLSKIMICANIALIQYIYDEIKYHQD